MRTWERWCWGFWAACAVAACADGTSGEEPVPGELTALPPQATSPEEAGSSKGDGASSGRDGSRAADANAVPDTWQAPLEAGGDASQGIDAADASDAGVDALFVDADDAGLTTFLFPTASDTAVIKTDPYMWNKGDHYEGTRSTTLAQATELTGQFIVVFNQLSPCGTIFLDVFLNGTKIGTANATQLTGSVALSFQFAPIAGPTYTLRYEVASTVPTACGAAWFSTMSSSVSLR